MRNSWKTGDESIRGINDPNVRRANGCALNGLLKFIGHLNTFGWLNVEFTDIRLNEWIALDYATALASAQRDQS